MSAEERGGWWTVWALSVAQLVSWGTMYESFSLLVVPMETELGWSRAAMNGALSLGLLTSGLCAFSVGSWVDRYGGWAIMTGGSGLGVVCLAAWSSIDDLVALYLVWIGLGVSMSATLYEPAFAVITRSFPQSFRSRITAMTLVGGFASTLFIPVTQLLIHTLGWRQALVALALCNLAVALPIHAYFLRGLARPRSGPELPRLETKAENQAAIRRALRHPVFWGLAVCFTMYFAASTALFFHIIPLLTERNFSPAVIAGVLAIRGPAQVAARFGMLTLTRQLRTELLGRVILAVFPLSLLLLVAFPFSTVALVIFVLLYGGVNGMMTIIRGTAIPDMLGREGYGAINGALTLPTNVIRAAAPFGAALVWGVTEDYSLVLWLMIGGGAVATAAFWYAAQNTRTGLLAR